MSEHLNNEEGNKSNMYYGANPALFILAEELRAKMTDAEEKLWSFLKKNEWHAKFRRQHPISNYIADFYCHQLKLVIELDGGYHEHKEVKIYDTKRENDIAEFSIKVLRFKNEEVIQDIKTVLKKIGEVILTVQQAKTKTVNSSNYPPLGDGGKAKPVIESLSSFSSDQAKTQTVNSSNYPPLGDGGQAKPAMENLSSFPSEQPTTETVNSSNYPPLGDGGKTPLFVIKIGGNVIDDPSSLNAFLQNFASINAKKILVHGGGKIATKIGGQLGIQSNYINGRRITDEATIDLVTMVYGGLVNKKVVAQLQSMQCNAIGLTGADGNIIPATKRPIVRVPATKAGSSNTPPLGDGGNSSSNEDTFIDYGFVGDIKTDHINASNLEILLANNFTLIIAPLTHDGNGQMLNTNADTIASSLAVALSKTYSVRLIYCFEKAGVLENVDDENSVISLITKQKYQQLLQENKLFAGILPKIDNAFAAIENGVNEVLIGDAKDLLQNVTPNTKGTLIK